MNVTVIGCAGSFPNAGSACSAYLVEHEGFSLLLDMGNGSVGALQRYAALLAPDAVFLSHLHADHCVDLVAYSYARKYHPEPLGRLPVHGPQGTHERLQQIGNAGRLDDVFAFTDTSAGRTDIGPFAVTLAPAAHPVETYSIRLEAGGRTVVYSGDTGPTPELVINAKNADLLLCEATWTTAGPADLHMTAAEAGEHAHRADAGRLLLVHTTPFSPPETLVEQAGQHYDRAIEIAAAGTTYAV